MARDTARPDKVAVVDDVRARLEGSAATLLTDYRGLSVGEMADLRTELRKAKAQYIVAKNTLGKIAANEAGISGFDEYLVGPTAWVFCEEGPVEAAKALKAFAKDHPALLIKAGLLDGAILDGDETMKLADLDSREDLMIKMVSLMQGALSGTARLMNALTEKQARLITALIEAGGNPDVAEAPVAAEPEAAAPAEDAPADDAPVADEAPATEDAPAADEAPAESDQAEEAPQADTAAESAQADEAPTAEAAAQDAPAAVETVDEAPAESAQADEAPTAEAAVDAGGEAIDGGGEVSDAVEEAAEASTPEDEAPATPEEAVAQDVPTVYVSPAPEPADDVPTAPAAAADEVADDADVEAASDELDPDA